MCGILYNEKLFGETKNENKEKEKWENTKKQK